MKEISKKRGEKFRVLGYSLRGLRIRQYHASGQGSVGHRIKFSQFCGRSYQVIHTEGRIVSPNQGGPEGRF